MLDTQELSYEIRFTDGTKRRERLTYRKRLAIKRRKEWSNIISIGRVYETEIKPGEPDPRG